MPEPPRLGSASAICAELYDAEADIVASYGVIDTNLGLRRRENVRTAVWTTASPRLPFRSRPIVSLWPAGQAPRSD
jgi:hypothetical protein